MNVTYNSYQKTGLDWLGEIPSHWSVVRLGTCFDERREKVNDVDFPPLSVTKNGIVPQLETAAKTDAGDNRKRVVAGDFVINSRSDRKGSSGVSKLDGSVSLISIVLTPNGINSKYVHHLLRSYPFQEEFYRFGKGIVADLWSTNYSEMKNINIPLPSPEEQTAIANFLDRETDKIDTLIEKQERLIKLLQEKRQAVISHAVTKGLDQNVKMKDSGVEWLGEVPENWKVIRLSRVGNVGQGCSFSHSLQGRKSGDLAWFKVADMNLPNNFEFMHDANNYIDSKLADEIKAPIFSDGTVIFPRVGAALLTNKRRILTKPSVVDDNIFTFTPKNIDSRFAYMVFRLINMETLCSPGLVPTVTFGAVNSVRIPLPPIAEQERIVQYIDQILVKIVQLTNDAERAIELLKERRVALISAAVTGKIDVRNVA